jgi:hypothetical protein
MPEQASFQCPRCQQMRLFTRNGVNHILHLLVSLFLCGMWIPIWILVTATSSNNPYYCSTCGYANSPDILANPMRAEQRRLARELKRNTPSNWQTTYFPYIKSKYSESPAFFIFVVVMISLMSIISFALLYELTRKPELAPIASKPRNPPADAPNQTVKPLETNTTVTRKTKVSPKAKSAVVISANAKLLNSADQKGFVLQTLMEGESVEVIKQQGAWFYVDFIGQKGWMHGNTIKFVGSN